ncbi:MAG: hypothetical protein V4666_00205 [Bacteroidota bacterium]
MKNNLKKIKQFLFLIISLILVSCSEEHFDGHFHNHNVNKNQVSFKQFKNETKLKNFESFKSINISSESSRVSDFQFLIDTTKVLKHTSSTNEITYSFKIYPMFEHLESNEYYNLVYEKNGAE